METDDLRRRIEPLEKKLRPIADTPVAFGPDLRERLRSLHMPNDAEANEALVDAIDLYSRSDAGQRDAIREIFRTNRAFAWAAALSFPPDSPARLRQHLIHFSMIDQGRDWRDAILWLRDLLQSPYASKELVNEVAEMSSDWARSQIMRTISI